MKKVLSVLLVAFCIVIPSVFASETLAIKNFSMEQKGDNWIISFSFTGADIQEIRRAKLVTAWQYQEAIASSDLWLGGARLTNGKIVITKPFFGESNPRDGRGVKYFFWIVSGERKSNVVEFRIAEKYRI